MNELLSTTLLKAMYDSYNARRPKCYELILAYRPNATVYA